MKKVFKAEISYKVLKSHPDIEYVKNTDEVLSFNDTYTMNSDYYDNEEQMTDFIKNDLALVAGGGYNTDHIYNVKYDIQKIG